MIRVRALGEGTRRPRAVLRGGVVVGAGTSAHGVDDVLAEHPNESVVVQTESLYPGERDDRGGRFRALKRGDLAEVVPGLQAVNLLAAEELDGALAALDDVELGALRLASGTDGLALRERARHDGIREPLPVVVVEPLQGRDPAEEPVVRLASLERAAGERPLERLAIQRPHRRRASPAPDRRRPRHRVEERDLAERVARPQRPDLLLLRILLLLVRFAAVRRFVCVATDGDDGGPGDDDVKVEALLSLPHHRLARGVLEAVHGPEQRVAFLGAQGIENRDTFARGRDGGDVGRGFLGDHAAVGGEPALERCGSFSGAGIFGSGAGVPGGGVGATGVDEREPAANPDLELIDVDGRHGRSPGCPASGTMGWVQGALGRKRHRFQNETSQNRRSGSARARRVGGDARMEGAAGRDGPSDSRGRTTRRGEVRAEVTSGRYDGAPGSGAPPKNGGEFGVSD